MEVVQADRTKRIPFFVDKPDENLVRYVEQLEIPVSRVLELGSGPGRNALYLAEHGSQVDAIDLAPHRRPDYIRIVSDALRPGGCFALTCFVEGGQDGGSDMTDWDVYRQRSLNGGLGFTEEKLRSIFDTFAVRDIRLMQEAAPTDPVFGLSGLWTALFRKKLIG